MRTPLVVIHSPLFTHAPCFFQADEPVLAQALVTELPVEALDITVLHRLARIDEAQRDSTLGRPLIHGLTCELRAVVHDDVQRLPPHSGESFEHSDDTRAWQARVHFDG